LTLAITQSLRNNLRFDHTTAHVMLSHVYVDIEKISIDNAPALTRLFWVAAIVFDGDIATITLHHRR
jgi:hypothetical protein